MSHSMDAKITEQTLLPISLIITLVGGITFVSYVAFEGASNAKAIDEIQKKQETIEKIATDVAVIKTKVETIERSIERKH